MGEGGSRDERPGEPQRVHGARGGQRQGGPDARDPLKPYHRILEEELGMAERELERPTSAILTSGLLAGLIIGVSVLLLGALETLPGEVASSPWHRFLAGNAYALGFVLVIFAQADLFTEYTTIALLPALLGRSGYWRVGRLWGLVYVANLAGAILVAAFLVWLGRGHGAVPPAGFRDAAEVLTGYSMGGMVLSGVLAGWLMGLMSWLVVAARETISQVIFVWLIGTTIGLAGLHHCITGSAEVAASWFAGGAGAGDLLRVLAASTAGNAMGAVIFAALIRYSVASLGSGAGEA